MAALTADVHIPHKGTPTKMSFPAVAGGDTFFAGALVYTDATAGLVQAVPAAGDVFLGIVAKQVVADAGDMVEVYVDGIHALKYGSAAEGDQANAVILNIGTTQSDNEADMTAEALAALELNDILIGKMLGMDTNETDRAWVRLIPGFKWEDTDKAWI